MSVNFGEGAGLLLSGFMRQFPQSVFQAKMIKKEREKEKRLEDYQSFIDEQNLKLKEAELKELMDYHDEMTNIRREEIKGRINLERDKWEFEKTGTETALKASEAKIKELEKLINEFQKPPGKIKSSAKSPTASGRKNVAQAFGNARALREDPSKAQSIFLLGKDAPILPVDYDSADAWFNAHRGNEVQIPETSKAYPTGAKLKTKVTGREPLKITIQGKEFDFSNKDTARKVYDNFKKYLKKLSGQGFLSKEENAAIREDARKAIEEYYPGIFPTGE